jgi:hypothetical protein
MKMQNDIIELMHREIDGLNTADESARLSEYLKGHADYAQMYDELRDLSTMLGSVKDLTPRKHLTAKIMKSVRELSASHRQSPRSFEFFRSLSLRPVMIFASGLALGCILIVSLSKYSGDSSVDARHLLGTFVGRNSLDEMVTVGSASLEGEGVNGALTAKRSDDLILLNVSVHASHETTLRMTYNADEVRFKGFVNIENGSTTAATVGGGELRCTFSGEHAYAIIFDVTNPRTSSLGVEMMNGNQVVLARSVTTALQ